MFGGGYATTGFGFDMRRSRQRSMVGPNTETDQWLSLGIALALLL